MTFQSLKQKIEANPQLLVSERGTGKARFLYVRSLYRAIEISEEGEGFYIEYWNSADEESDDAPVREEFVISESSVFAKIEGWLT